MQQFTFLGRRLLLPMLAAAALLSAGRASAQTGPTYNISVNTITIDNVLGYFQLEFDPGGTGTALNATATVSGLQLGGGSLNGGTVVNPTMTAGSVSGSLPGPLTITNTAPPGNYLLQGVTFGNLLDFNVAFAGAAFNNTLTSTSGSDFTLTLYDQSGATLPTTLDPNDPAIADISINATNSNSPTLVTTTTYPTPGPSLATITLVPSSSTAIPEANPALLLAVGLAALGLLRTVGLRRLREA